jgi:transcription antitermination factor NusG
MSDERWYAVRTRSNFEQKAAWYLEANGQRVFLPTYRDKRKWSDRIKEIDVPLFNGYVFCRIAIDDRLPVLRAPGVVDIVSFGSRFEPVPDEQIDSVRAMIGSGLRVRPWPFLHVGQHVRIDHGPLAGVEGILTEIRNECRLIVSIPLLQRSVAAEVERDWLTSIPQPVRKR